MCDAATRPPGQRRAGETAVRRVRPAWGRGHPPAAQVLAAGGCPHPRAVRRLEHGSATRAAATGEHTARRTTPLRGAVRLDPEGLRSPRTSRDGDRVASGRGQGNVDMSPRTGGAPRAPPVPLMSPADTAPASPLPRARSTRRRPTTSPPRHRRLRPPALAAAGDAGRPPPSRVEADGAPKRGHPPRGPHVHHLSFGRTRGRPAVHQPPTARGCGHPPADPPQRRPRPRDRGGGRREDLGGRRMPAPPCRPAAQATRSGRGISRVRSRSSPRRTGTARRSRRPR
jgi:hypothetical protein